MKLKLDEDGHAVVEDGKPVYVADDGGERAVDVLAMEKSLSRANEEAASRRIKLEQAEARLKLFKDIEPDAAREAIAFRKTLGDDVDPEKVTVQIADLTARNEGLAAQIEDAQAKLGNAGETIDRLTLGNAIAQSEFIGSKVNPALRDEKLFRAAYGEHLHIEDGGAIVVKDGHGNTIMGEGGKPATLDEALPKIVTNPRHLAPGNASGGGEAGKNGGARGGKKIDLSDTKATSAALREFVEAGGSARDFYQQHSA